MLSGYFNPEIQCPNCGKRTRIVVHALEQDRVKHVCSGCYKPMVVGVKVFAHTMVEGTTNATLSQLVHEHMTVGDER